MTDSPATVGRLMRAFPLLAAIFIAACSHDVPVAGATSLDVPATYRGDLPCADCPGIRHTLQLLPDNRYVLRLEYLGRGTTFEEDGHWRMDKAQGVLVLEERKDGPSRLQIASPTTLVMLDMQGQAVDSDLNYTLTRSP